MSRINNFELETYSTSRFKVKSYLQISSLSDKTSNVCSNLYEISEELRDLTLKHLYSADFYDKSADIVNMASSISNFLKQTMESIYKDVEERFIELAKIDASFAEVLAESQSEFNDALNALTGMKSIEKMNRDTQIASSSTESSSGQRNLLEPSSNIGRREANPETMQLIVNNSELLKQYPNGSLRRITDESGKSYDVYVPNDVNPDTPIMLYHPGDGLTADWYTYKKAFETSNPNAVIAYCGRVNDTKLYDKLVSTCGLNGNTSPMNITFSGGGMTGIEQAANISSSSNNSGRPQISAIMDSYLAPSYLESKGYTSALKDNGSIILAFSERNPSVNTYDRQYRNLARSGVNMLILRDTSSEFGGSHARMNSSFINGGVVDYLSGTGTLPDRYVVEQYNQSTNSFDIVDRSNISSLEDLYIYFS